MLGSPGDHESSYDSDTNEYVYNIYFKPKEIKELKKSQETKAFEDILNEKKLSVQSEEINVIDLRKLCEKQEQSQQRIQKKMIKLYE